MKKEILHFRIPINKRGEEAICRDVLHAYAQILEDHFGREYEVIFSPFEIGSIGAEAVQSYKLSEKSMKDFLEKYNLKKE